MLSLAIYRLESVHIAHCRASFPIAAPDRLDNRLQSGFGAWFADIRTRNVHCSHIAGMYSGTTRPGLGIQWFCACFDLRDQVHDSGRQTKFVFEIRRALTAMIDYAVDVRVTVLIRL